MPRPRPCMLLLAQAAVAIGCFAILAMWPPASGRILLIPLTGDQGSAVRRALSANALLLGAGPIAGSLVVAGERSRILAGPGSRAVLVLAAPPAGCGSGVVQELTA